MKIKKVFLFASLFVFLSSSAFCSQIKDVTFLIYVSARNNLAVEAIEDINEMEAGHKDSRINVVAEMGRIKGEPIFNPFTSVTETMPPQNEWTGSRRFLISNDSDNSVINSKILSYEPNADMGDYKRLADFISWGKKNYPAKKYVLIVGGHGSGWRGVKPTDKGISYDEISKNHFSPYELALAIKEAGKVDVYASDACLMQTFEVLYELKDLVSYIVGSQETTPGDGYNYEKIFSKLAKTGLDEISIVNTIIESFTEHHFKENKRSVTISAVFAPNAAVMAQKLDALAGKILLSSDDIKIYNQKRFSLRSYEDEDARDLYQLLKMYYENSSDSRTKSLAYDALAFLSDNFIVRNEAAGYKSKDSNGVSIHFPFFYMNYKPKYELLSFAKNTSWDELIIKTMDLQKNKGF